ncbi:MAG: hypothetical protein PHE09_02440 [Oscillospiraceae bacterium]|nr:hypothetical protein [Oscillospiraceae bacterium]
MKKSLLCVACLLIFSACQQSAEDADTSSFDSDSSKSVTIQTMDYTLPVLLTELTDDDKVLDIDCTLTRDDVGIQIPLAPIYIENLGKCFLKMGLVPYDNSQNTLDIPHPFTLTIYLDGKEGTISVTQEKVTFSGIDYSPTNSDAIKEFLEDDDDHKRLLTGDIYLLQEHMPFTADEVTQICLEDHENYSDGVTNVSITDREEIEKITQALSKTVVRQLETDEEPKDFYTVGGNRLVCCLTLQDGTQWSINSCGLMTITSPNGDKDVVVLSMKYRSVFGLLSTNSAVPKFQAHIDGVTPTVYETAYQVDNYQKSMTDIVPIDMYFDSDPVLMPKETYPCQLEWTDTAGKAVIPTEITATLYQPTSDSMDEVREGIPLKMKGDVVTLPGNAGKYFVTVHAQLTDNTWEEFIFSYRTTIYPTAFYDIGYGNNEGNVTLTRNDAGLAVTGTQNRKYVDFIIGLELYPSDGSQQDLPVLKPFTMTFSCNNSLYEFTLTNKGVSYNGQMYTVENLQIIENLYVPFDINDNYAFERIDYELRGFLTKDVAHFTDEFPFNADEIETFTIIKEEPKQRTSYKIDGLTPKKIIETLNCVVLGKNWQTEDYYTLRRYYFSYEVVLKDGTAYEIGERILKNGVDTGWYTIQSDSPLASQQIKGLDGVTQQRDKAVYGNIRKDKGNIIID